MRAFTENVRNAFQSLASSWLRTSLTTVGMIIGVGSVALLVSIGLGKIYKLMSTVSGHAVQGNLRARRLGEHVFGRRQRRAAIDAVSVARIVWT